jgi:ADP-ribosyl-[dinitrogen reductase] hydrolase
MSEDTWRGRLEACGAAPEAPASKRLACLLGGALGDALGYRVEFKGWAEIERVYGPAGIRLEDCSGTLVVSDDTQMTLFTLEGMVRARDVAEIVAEVREAYLDWYATQERQAGGRTPRGGLAKVPEMRHPRAPGNTCLAALRGGGRGSMESRINDSKGCGGVMRTAPLGFLTEAISDAEVFRLGAECAALTHGHADGYLPAGAMAVLTRDALSGVTWKASVAKVLELVRSWPASEGTAAAIAAAWEASALGPSRERVRALGEGWVGEEALAIGLYCAVTAQSFAECVELATNHDGDSDSTASIAGQLWGARYGLAGVPMGMAKRVDVIEALVELFGEWSQSEKV